MKNKTWKEATEFKVTKLPRQAPQKYVPLRALELKKQQDRRIQEFFKSK